MGHYQNYTLRYYVLLSDALCNWCISQNFFLVIYPSYPGTPWNFHIVYPPAIQQFALEHGSFVINVPIQTGDSRYVCFDTNCNWKVIDWLTVNFDVNLQWASKSMSLSDWYWSWCPWHFFLKFTISYWFSMAFKWWCSIVTHEFTRGYISMNGPFLANMAKVVLNEHKLSIQLVSDVSAIPSGKRWHR